MDDVLFTEKVVNDFYSDLKRLHGRDKVDKIFSNNRDSSKRLRIVTRTDTAKNEELKKLIDSRLGSVCDGLDAYMYSTIREKGAVLDYAVVIEDSARPRVYAALFAQKGECEELPDIWNVRLVCNRSGVRTEGYEGNASKLLGLYVYALWHGDHPYGLLEVADGYNNVTAYCAYTRYGFTEVNVMCDFFTPGNLAMQILISSLGSRPVAKNRILNAVADRKQLVVDTDSTRHCTKLKAGRDATLLTPVDTDDDTGCVIL